MELKPGETARMNKEENVKQIVFRQAMLSYGYMIIWIILSAAAIMLNKYILDPQLGGFPFPLALTATHMMFSSAMAWLLVRLGFVEAQEIPSAVYLRCIVPIGALFALTLWTGNAVYLYLSVSYIQMMKAGMPLVVYAVGTCFGTEKWSVPTGINLVVVVAGVAIASYGEIVFVLTGMLCLILSMLAEATRLTLVQRLLQGWGIKLSPITTVYHVAPVCLASITIPLALLEAESLATQKWKVGPGLLLLSAAIAFALNCSVFLLIGTTSAVTMKVAGVLKDVMIIYLSMSLYGSTVTELQVVGYSIALCGVIYYNYSQLKSAQEAVSTLDNRYPSSDSESAACTVLLQRGCPKASAVRDAGFDTVEGDLQEDPLLPRPSQKKTLSAREDQPLKAA